MNLTPEKRPDRTGKLVTRWVKSFGRKSSKDLPAPALAQVSVSNHRFRNTERAKKIEEARTVLFSLGILDEVSSRTDKIEGNLSFLLDHSPELFEQVLQSARLGTNEVFYWQARMRYHRRSNDALSDEAVLLDFRRPLIILPFMKTLTDVDPSFIPDKRFTHQRTMEFDTAVGSILYPQQASGIIPSDETIEAVSMLVYLDKLYEDDNMEHGGHDYHRVYSKNLDDIEYLVSRLDDVRRIFPELATRKTSKRELVRELLDAPVPALAEGIL